MKFVQLLLAMVLVSAVAGCVDDQATQQKLAEGKVALEQQQYQKAVNAADAVLQNNPNNVDAAAAHYLRGRSIEQQPKSGNDVAQNDMSIARTEYNRALQLAPPKKLEGYIRASLANVDYFQDDYQDALDEWSKAYGLLDDKDLKAWALYRIGICQQRLGHFEQADKTFMQVQEIFQQTEQAKLARERVGARGFYVQLATFNSGKSADNAVTELKEQGVKDVTKSTDLRGLTTIRVGPYATYGQALETKGRFASKYNDAIILP